MRLCTHSPPFGRFFSLVLPSQKMSGVQRQARTLHLGVVGRGCISVHCEGWVGVRCVGSSSSGTSVRRRCVGHWHCISLWFENPEEVVSTATGTQEAADEDRPPDDLGNLHARSHNVGRSIQCVRSTEPRERIVVGIVGIIIRSNSSSKRVGVVTSTNSTGAAARRGAGARTGGGDAPPWPTVAGVANGAAVCGARTRPQPRRAKGSRCAAACARHRRRGRRGRGRAGGTTGGTVA